MNYTNLLKNIWDILYNPEKDVVQTIERFFYPEYEQCINGVLMKRDEYIAHVQEQKKNMVINFIKYKHMMEKGNEVFALYYPSGMNKNKSPIEAEVIAYVCFKEQQIIKIHGQVRLISGEHADVDMKNA